jgi:hypothetical protein
VESKRRQMGSKAKGLCLTAQFRKDARSARSIRPESGGDLKKRTSRADSCGTARKTAPASFETASTSASTGANGATSMFTARVAPRHMQPDSFSHEPGGRLIGSVGEPSAFTCREAIAATTSAAPTWQCQFDTSTSSENAAGRRGRKWEMRRITTSSLLGREGDFNGSMLLWRKRIGQSTRTFTVSPH